MTDAAEAPATSETARPRLTRDDWTRAALRALVPEGAAGLRVEAIARDLGATKGSFYWHFKDGADLRAAVLAAWEALAARETADILGHPGRPARKRMMALVDLVLAPAEAALPGQAAEPALRDWARHDPLARETLARADAARQDGVRALLSEAGLGTAAAARGAATFHAALIGFALLRQSSGAEVRRNLAGLADAVLDGRL